MLAKNKAQRPAMKDLLPELEGLAKEVGGPTPRGRRSAHTLPVISSPALPVGPITTLGGSHGQRLRLPRRWPAMAVGLALSILISSVIAWRLSALRGSPTPVATPALIHWKLQSQPPGALVIRIRDDKVLGQTPLDTYLAKEPDSVSISLRLTGYAAKTVLLKQDQDDNVLAVLTPLAPPARKTVETAPRNKAVPGPSKRKRYERVEMED